MYQVRIERKAQKQLNKIPNPYYSKIKTAILDLSKEPRPQGYKKLKGRNGYRIRIADYRVIYEVIDQELIIDVIDVDSRGNIYKK